MSVRQQRHLAFIAEFAPSIRHIMGESNIVADTLSSSSSECSAPSYSSMAATSVLTTCNGPGAIGQGSNEVKSPTGPSVPPAIAGSSSPPSPVDLTTLVAVQGMPILVDTSSGVFRPLVPAAFRRHIFSALHSVAHLSIRATKWLIASRFIWSCLASQVAAWCRDCQQCQRAKVTSQLAVPLSHIANPVQQLSHIHINLVGPLPATAEGLTHLFTVVDWSTRWAEAIPLRSTLAASCTEALISGWVSRSHFRQRLAFLLLSLKRSNSPAGSEDAFYDTVSSQSNGLVEWFHSCLKDTFRARMASADWIQHIPWVLMGLQAAPREDSCISVA
jgi:hypothetical protein